MYDGVNERRRSYLIARCQVAYFECIPFNGKSGSICYACARVTLVAWTATTATHQRRPSQCWSCPTVQGSHRLGGGAADRHPKWPRCSRRSTPSSWSWITSGRRRRSRRWRTPSVAAIRPSSTRTSPWHLHLLGPTEVGKDYLQPSTGQVNRRFLRSGCSCPVVNRRSPFAQCALARGQQAPKPLPMSRPCANRGVRTAPAGRTA